MYRIRIPAIYIYIYIYKYILEICELIGLFILHSLENRFGKKIGLYGDDGLAAINTTPGRLGDKARKDLIRIF